MMKGKPRDPRPFRAQMPEALLFLLGSVMFFASLWMFLLGFDIMVDRDPGILWQALGLFALSFVVFEFGNRAKRKSMREHQGVQQARGG
jgi:hypothetical protein